MAGSDTQGGKIVKYRRYGWLNIGTILFGAIFIYMIITVIVYMTAKHTTTYEVTAGSISGNYRYTALALKHETIIPADYSGYVTYYARDGGRTGSGMIVCSIDENKQDIISDSELALQEEDYSNLRKTFSSFALNFSDSSFQDVYNLKADLRSYFLEASQQAGLIGGLLNQVTAPEAGFVSYTIDGMESLEETDITGELFNRTNYNTTNLRLHDQVRMGENLYKLITGEEWYLYFPITSSLATELADRTTVRFRFLKDDTTFSARFAVLNSGSEYFGKITLRNSLVRYVTDRYLQIELLMDSKKGLKIPTSSIAEKVFFRIPAEYVVSVGESDNGSEITLLRETFRNDGSSVTGYVTATVYDKQNNYYLVSRDLFRIGDYVQLSGSAIKHQIVEADLTTVQGVYNINKGYAVFREVTVIDANEEFCIVEPYNPYGLAAHDFIALDASQLDDGDVI